MHNLDIEIFLLVVEQRRAKRPEFVRRKAEYGGAGFVRERAGRVPGLDLLAEDDGDGGGVFGFYEGEDGAVEGAEQFGGELRGLLTCGFGLLRGQIRRTGQT